MTDDRIPLIDLTEKGGDSDLVRELPDFAAARMRELEVEGRTGAPAGDPQSGPADAVGRLSLEVEIGALDGRRRPGESTLPSQICRRPPICPHSFSHAACQLC